MEELNNVRAKWYNIGLQLHVSVGTLDAVKEQYDDLSHCLRETLKTWLKTCPSAPTWSNIVDALRSSTVGEVRLAADLEQKYYSQQDIAASHQHAPPVSAIPPSQTHTWTPAPQSSVPLTHPLAFDSSYSMRPQSHPSHLSGVPAQPTIPQLPSCETMTIPQNPIQPAVAAGM